MSKVHFLLLRDFLPVRLLYFNTGSVASIQSVGPLSPLAFINRVGPAALSV